MNFPKKKSDMYIQEVVCISLTEPITPSRVKSDNKVSQSARQSARSHRTSTHTAALFEWSAVLEIGPRDEESEGCNLPMNCCR
jgi:hypothetical protein